MKRHLLIIFTLVLLAPAGMAQETTASAPSVAQDFNKSKLDQYFDALEAGDRFMGSVAVSRNGELIYSRSLGFADMAKNKRRMPPQNTGSVPFPKPSPPYWS